MPKYAGVEWELGGEKYVIPPLSLRQVRGLSATIESLDLKHIGPEALDEVVKIIHAAFSRNYPEITVDQIFDLIDLGNMKDVLNSVLATSGYVMGESKRVAGNGSIGETSTVSSSPPLVGLTTTSMTN